MALFSFNVVGRVWVEQDSYQEYSESIEIDAPTLSKALKKVQAELFDKFGTNSSIFRARFRIKCNDLDFFEMMGSGAGFDLAEEEIQKLQNDINCSKRVSICLREVIGRYPWITKTDLATAFKSAFPGLSGEVSQLIWNWCAGATDGIKDDELDVRIDGHLHANGYK